MVKEAKKSRNSYDEVWVVFDRDRERDPQNLQAIELASQSKIKVAFSSISFEEWVLLHFERSTKAFERSDCESRSTKKNPTDCTCDGRVCICTYLKKHFYPGYAKGKAKLYDDLSEKRDLALENAAWQKHYSNTKNHHLANPYTDVDNLVLQLFELPKIRYESTNIIFTFEGIDFCVRNNPKECNAISIQTMNPSSQSSCFHFWDTLKIRLTFHIALFGLRPFLIFWILYV